MKREPTNIAASVLARLKNMADREGLDYNVLLVRYVQERFLSRLAGSAYASRLILKGGFLLVAYNARRARPTRDIDFLGIDLSSELMGIEQIVREIVSVDQGDGVAFVADSLRSQLIKEEERYHGARVKLAAMIGSARIALQVDFGFGDIVSPHPLRIGYPTLLEDGDLSVAAYSKESIVAEKFEAVIRLGVFNTRMKDFFDIVFLAGEFDFEATALHEAMRRTFDQRQMSMRQAERLLASEIESNAKLSREWDAFMKRSPSSIRSDFVAVVDTIRRFLSPVAHDEIERESQNSVWNCMAGEWMKGER